MHSRPPSPIPAPFAPAARATTAPVKSKHPIPHHPHHRLHHQHNHGSRSTTQPQVVNSFGADSPISRISSRSEGGPAGEQEKALAEAREAEREREAWKVVNWKKEERGRINEHLQDTLQSLTDLSANTTRRLDYTYYSLLEHSSVLATLLSSLSALSTTISQQVTHFSSSTASLATSFETQIHAFEQTFGTQAERIGELEQRLRQGRRRVGELGDRLDGVRKRVEKSEKGEREWQERVRRRLRVLWGVFGSLLGIFVVLLVLRCWPRERGDGIMPITRNQIGRSLGLNGLGAAVTPPRPLKKVSLEGKKSSFGDGKGGGSVHALTRGDGGADFGPCHDDDQRLRLLDEL